MLREAAYYFSLLDKNRHKKTIIWGVKENGLNSLKDIEHMGGSVDFFIDKACPVGEHKTLLGKKIYNPSVLESYAKNDIFVIIASSNHYKEIEHELAQNGFLRNENFISPFGTLQDIGFYKYHEDSIEYIKQIKDNLPLFKSIEIETINKCNNNCSFCPVNVNNDSRELKIMSEELLHSILEQLRNLNYTGNISLFSNNEPFMDNRIIRFFKTAKEMLPDAFHYVFTNGTLLTLDKFIDSMKYLDMIIIDNYDDSYEFLPNVKEIYHYCLKRDDLKDRVKICKRLKNQQLTTRGGQAPNRERISVSGITCLLPFQQLIVRPDGKISLCCNDAMGKYTLGDLNCEKISDIWYGGKYKEIRDNLLIGRETMNLCSGCDTLIGRPSDEYYKSYGGPNLLNI